MIASKFCAFYVNVSLDMETDEVTVDDQTTMPNTIETPNTFVRGILRRMRFSNEAEAASSSNNNNNNNC